MTNNDKMKIGIKVGDIMTRDFVSVTPATTIQECAKIMTKKRVGSLILREDNQLKGIITERDIIWALTKKSCADLSKIKASDIGKRKVATIKPSADLNEALDLMRKSKYRRLPVVNQGNLIGFLTLKDILNIEPGLFEIARNMDAFRIREVDDKMKRRSIRAECKNSADGVCEECGNYNALCDIGGRLLCESCKDNI